MKLSNVLNETYILDELSPVIIEKGNTCLLCVTARIFGADPISGFEVIRRIVWARKEIHQLEKAITSMTSLLD